MLGDKVKLLLYAVVGGGFVFLIFPIIKPIVSGVSTTGWSALTIGGWTVLPYVFIGLMGYGIYLILKGHGNG